MFDRWMPTEEERAEMAGHLSPTGKGRATPAELADDLLGYLHAAARSR